jgi:hypothetical protein
MFCPYTNLDCVRDKCLMYEAVETDADSPPPTEADYCLMRVKTEAEIDFYNTATTVLEQGLPKEEEQQPLPETETPAED